MQDVPERHNYPGSEVQVSAYWDQVDAFQTCLKQSEGKPVYSFYDGPPFATGLPHYGHILAGTIKDIVTRYAHQTGHHVDRRFGWDCHGLPIEFEIDKELGIKTQEQVLQYGIGNYNEKCRSIVMRYSAEWEKSVKRLGRWIDFRRDYKTMNPEFMETVWWVFGQLYEKGLVYRGYKVMPYSTGCTTPLSNFEATLHYLDIQDPTAIVSFPLVDDPNVSLVAWTTTPWTLPSNLALCVHPSLVYVQLKKKDSDTRYVVAETLISSLFKEESEYTVEKKFPGKELEGKKYKPLFDYFEPAFPNAYKVLVDPYVTDSDGTGIVHNAPGFGEDDFRVCIRDGICSVVDVPCPINDIGQFLDPVFHFKGMYIKDANSPILKHLTNTGRLVSRATLNHRYPFCWRSDTPLIYRAIPSWFVKVSAIKDQLLQNNAQTYWVPDFVKEKRFHNWLLDARDWAISRNRYWGTPLPIWASDDYEEIVVISSLDELEKRSGIRLTDLHRHHVDNIVIKSEKGKGNLKRVPEVFDCWFESGSMPYAQQHYPFENKEIFEKSFPADFIAEGIDQTRGWFYTLLVISTALFEKPPFKNLIVNGLVLAADGKKMSKRLKNYPDPGLIVDKYGADSLRLYLINSPVVRGEKLKFQETGVAEVMGEVFNRWYNSYRFLVQNVIRIKVETGKDFVYDPHAPKKSANVTDKWILAYLQSLIQFVRQEMKAYRLYTVVPRLVKFIESLANWYLRLNRGRLKGKSGVEEEHKSLSTMAFVLLTMCRMMAPFTPFFVETLYQNLKHLLPENERQDSVHYLSFPEVDESLFNPEIELHMSRMQEVIELGRLARDRAVCPVRQPLKNFIVLHTDKNYLESLKFLETYIHSELAIANLVLRSDVKESVTQTLVPNNATFGPKVTKDRSKVEQALALLTHEQVVQFQQEGKIVILGHELVADDLTVRSEFNGGDTKTKYQASSNARVVTVLDLTKDQEQMDGRLVKEMSNRIQRLRKQAKLVHTDHVIAFYSWSVAANELSDYNLDRVLSEHRAQLESTTHCSVVSAKFRHPCYVRLDSQTSNLFDSVNVSLELCVPDVAIDVEKVKSAGYDADTAFCLLLSQNPAKIPASLAAQLNGHSIQLQKGSHWFEHVGELAKSLSYPFNGPTVVKEVKEAKPAKAPNAKPQKAAAPKSNAKTEKKSDKNPSN